MLRLSAKRTAEKHVRGRRGGSGACCGVHVPVARSTRYAVSWCSDTWSSCSSNSPG